MHKSVYRSILAFFLLVGIFSGMKIYGHFQEQQEQEELYEG